MQYTGLQGKVFRMLEAVPWTRERHRKDEALVKLITAKKDWNNNVVATFSLKELTYLAHDFNSADRYWRQHLSNHPELRGMDYDTKEIVEQRKEIQLGYEPGFHEVNKKIETLVA
jgi:hypothetical protein